jgi:hypothetical protein
MASLSPRDWIQREPKLLAKRSAEFVKKTLENWKGEHTSPDHLKLVTSPEIDFSIPDALLKGTTMTKVSGKTQKKKVFQLDPDEGHILYKKSGKNGIGACFVPRLPLSSSLIFPTFYQSQLRASQRSVPVQTHGMIAFSSSSPRIPRHAGSQ